jgi:SAM-dependent methyltransferase
LDLLQTGKNRCAMQLENQSMAQSAPNMLPSRLVGRLGILECIKCSGSLSHQGDALVCERCKSDFPVRGGKVYFDLPPAHETAAAGLKERLKKLLGRRYNLLVDIVAPIFPFNARKAVVEYVDPAKNVVVDLGAGARRIHPDIITLDLFDYDTVDIVCGLDRLPFAPGSIDGFVSLSVIEHLADPFALVESLHRASRSGAIGIHHVPFLYHFHESPRDFTRFTHMGLSLLFKKWKTVRVFNTSGPVSLMMLLGIEITSSLAAFGNNRVKELFYLALCGLTFPLKILDWPFRDRASVFSYAPSFCIVVEKKGPSAE